MQREEARGLKIVLNNDGLHDMLNFLVQGAFEEQSMYKHFNEAICK